MKDDLYQADILAWVKKSTDTPITGHIDCRATVHNTLCGDRVTVELRLNKNVIADIACRVKGCMLSKASGAHMVDLLKGRPTSIADELYQAFKTALNSEQDPPTAFPETHRPFTPVKSRKSRHTCVLLPYQAVLEALASQEATI